MQQDTAIKVKSVNLVENGALVQVGSDLYIDLAKTFVVDSITPHTHLDTPTRVQVNGDLSVGSSATHVLKT